MPPKKSTKSSKETKSEAKAESETKTKTSTATATATKKKKPTGKLTCPACGGTKFYAEDGVVIYCGECGENADWAYTKENAELAMKYVEEETNSRAPSENTLIPLCTGKSAAKEGECGGQSWVLTPDGSGIHYCGVCGSTWKGDQPDEEVMDAIRQQRRNVSPPAIGNTEPLSDSAARRLKDARRGQKVNIEDYTVRD